MFGFVSQGGGQSQSEHCSDCETLDIYGIQKLNSTSKFKTRLRNSKLDFEIQNSTSKFKTRLRNSKFDFEIQNLISKFKTRLRNSKIPNTIYKSKNAMQNNGMCTISTVNIIKYAKQHPITNINEIFALLDRCKKLIHVQYLSSDIQFMFTIYTNTNGFTSLKHQSEGNVTCQQR
jgi:hypothetical protein